jgi:hypothetical protein
MQPQIRSQKKSVRKLFLLSCGAFSLLLTIYCLYALYTIVNFKESRFVAIRSNPFDTAQAFAYSLAYNRLDTVKTYVAKDKWDFIDSWGSTHEAISSECKNWDNPSGVEFAGSPGIDGKTYIATYWIFHDCPEYGYALTVSIELKLSDNGWEITNWTEICETKGAEEKCYE